MRTYYLIFCSNVHPRGYWSNLFMPTKLNGERKLNKEIAILVHAKQKNILDMDKDTYVSLFFASQHENHNEDRKFNYLQFYNDTYYT